MSTASHGKPIDLSDSDIPAAPWAAGPVAAIEFWSFRCEASRLMAPLVSDLARDEDGARIFKVNVDNCPRLAAKFGVNLVPALVVMKGDREGGRLLEAWTSQQAKALVEGV